MIAFGTNLIGNSKKLVATAQPKIVTLGLSRRGLHGKTRIQTSSSVALVWIYRFFSGPATAEKERQIQNKAVDELVWILVSVCTLEYLINVQGRYLAENSLKCRM